MGHKWIFYNTSDFYQLKISDAVPEYNTESPAGYGGKALKPGVRKYWLCLSNWVASYVTTSVVFGHLIYERGCTGKYLKSAQLQDSVMSSLNI